MSRRLHFAVAGPIGQITGGYIYDARIADGLSRPGREVRIHELAGRHPWPDEAAFAAARTCLDAVRGDDLLLVDGLALPAFVPCLQDRSERAPLVALVHHPLADETGQDEAARRQLDRWEREALSHARRVVVTSGTTAEAVARMGVPRERIGVVPPGVDRPAAPLAVAPPAARDGRAEPVLLCVATVTPRKAHLLLVEALAGLARLPWRLDCIGSTERDPATAADVRAAIARHGLTGRILLHGERPTAEMPAAYAAADLFVLPSFHEGFGMAFAEALMHGVPVVGTRAGAIPETVPGDAGLLVPPGDVPALREALRGLLEDRAALDRLAAGARRAVFPSWEDAAAAFAAELDAAGG